MARKKFSYKQAMTELEGILSELNAGDVEIDQLQEKVKKARELLESCKNKLRETEKEINEILE